MTPSSVPLVPLECSDPPRRSTPLSPITVSAANNPPVTHPWPRADAAMRSLPPVPDTINPFKLFGRFELFGLFERFERFERFDCGGNEGSRGGEGANTCKPCEWPAGPGPGAPGSEQRTGYEVGVGGCAV